MSILQMQRRELIAGLGATAAWPMVARADDTVQHVGLVSIAASPDDPRVFGPFLDQIRKLGYVDGDNIVFERRFGAGRDEQIREFVTDLVRRKIAVIVVTGIRESIAAKEATATIPIVMIVNPDPIGMGLVRSLAHPGGNVTGLTTMDWDIYGKRIEILKQAVPDLRKAALLLSSGNPVYRRGSAWAAKVIADSSLLGVDLSIAETGSNNIDAAIASAIASGAQCLVGASDGVVLGNAKDIAEIAMKHRLPTIFAFRQNVELGGLMMYGARLTELSRRAAYFVDRILKGADPGDMPIEQPTKFDFIINLKTAKALSLEIPPSLLARADEVIE